MCTTRSTAGLRTGIHDKAINHRDNKIRLIERGSREGMMLEAGSDKQVSFSSPSLMIGIERSPSPADTVPIGKTMTSNTGSLAQRSHRMPSRSFFVSNICAIPSSHPIRATAHANASKHKARSMRCLNQFQPTASTITVFMSNAS